MKKFVLIIAVLLYGVAAAAQPGQGPYSRPNYHPNPHNQGHPSYGNREQVHHAPGHQGPEHHGQPGPDHHGNGHHGQPAPGHGHTGPAHHHGHTQREVYCQNDWQQLWNGRHVRRFADRIWICNYEGDRILSGDRVILLPSGLYMVLNGGFWRILDREGERIFNLWGDEIELLANGIFRCRRGGRDFYYDERGNRR